MMCSNCGQPAVCQIKLQTLDSFCADCAPAAREQAGKNDTKTFAVFAIGAAILVIGVFGACIAVLGA